MLETLILNNKHIPTNRHDKLNKRTTIKNKNITIKNINENKSVKNIPI